MSLLKRREVNTEIEDKILTGMIISDSFCRDISKIINKDTFAVPFISKVAVWSKDYYKKYKQAPGLQITDIFEVEKQNLEESDQKAISTLLTRLSSEHEANDFNEEYLKDRSLEYFRQRNIKLANDKVSHLISIGRTEEAEQVLSSYKKATLLTSKWENIFSTDLIKNFFVDEENKKDILFQLPGDIGKFIGPFERNWLVGILAPTKRGKSFWLMELAIQATFNRKKVIFISLEMSSHQIKRRFYKRLTSMSKETRDYIFPIFDCQKNQENICNKKERKNSIRLLDSEGNKPKYNQELKYQYCSICRGTKDFIPSTWFTTIKKERMKTAQAIKMIRSEGSHFGSDLETLAYPSYSANLSQIRSDISILEESKGFVPDLIVIDYADILAPEDSRVIGRDRIDETWKTLKRMGEEFHGCVASASQSNRQSFEKRNVVQTDTGEDIRKIFHANLFLSINQTPQEKRDCCGRMAKIAVREEDFDQYEGVIFLQQLALGQVLLDSCLLEPSFDFNEPEFSVGI
jgi:replicative DNA helicase